MIQGKIKTNPDVILFRMNQKLDKATNLVETTITREAINLVAYVKSQKLSGQVLKRKTGRLSRSITYMTKKDGAKFTATVGTNVKYARAWEYGFSGTVGVRSFTRMQRVAFGKPMANPRMVTVRTFSKELNIPARPFLKPSLDENTDRIMTNLRAALTQGLSS